MSIRNRVTRLVTRQGLKLQKNSPHILFVAGVAGVVTSTVLACRATLKLEKTLEDIQYDIEGINQLEVVADSENPHYNKDKAYAYAKGGFELARLYAPAIAVGGVSLIALTGSHVQLSRRNTALTVAYTGLHQAYNEYRARVREHVGEDAERDLYHGVKLEKVEGSKELARVVDPNNLSVYAKIFDESNPNWSKDPEVNRLFVQCQQNYMNHRLHAVGHVFLNDCYDSLGFDRTRAGQVVGWVLGDEGDNYIDFNLFDCDSARFINNEERSIILDFNVDGVVLDKI